MNEVTSEQHAHKQFTITLKIDEGDHCHGDLQSKTTNNPLLSTGSSSLAKNPTKKGVSDTVQEELKDPEINMMLPLAERIL